MASLKFLSLASASVFLLQGTYTKASNDQALSNFVPADCLAQINEARALVGFGAFTALTDTTSGLAVLLADKTPEGLNAKVCAAVKSAVVEEVVNHTVADTNLAYHRQTGDKADCAAAVAHFKSGYSAISSGKPGAYKANEAPFNKASAVSFATVFYPKDGGSTECVFLKCGEAGTSASSNTSGDAAAKTSNAVVCIARPPTLVEGKEPFDDAQYTSLKKLQSSATTAVPALLALVAAAAGLALF